MRIATKRDMLRSHFLTVPLKASTRVLRRESIQHADGLLCGKCWREELVGGQALFEWFR